MPSRPLLSILLFSAALLSAQSESKTIWHPATADELREVIPARAPVEKERIETEFRTASGVTDTRGKHIAGVVLITAGYSADGKYSHFFVTQVPLQIGSFALTPGDYVIGVSHAGDSLTVKFYRAESGAFLGSVEAARQSRIGRIESFHVFPPGEKAMIAIGRFGFPYETR